MMLSKKKFNMFPVALALLSTSAYATQSSVLLAPQSEQGGDTSPSLEVYYDVSSPSKIYHDASGNIVKERVGKPAITINHVNDDGVSHIYYNKFNVPDVGLRLHNNSQADLIINEVVSNEPSLLNGELFVIGKKADIIIANPNGISCYDCSFSGVNDIKLITGSSQEQFSKEFDLSNEGIVFSFEKILKNSNKFSLLNRNFKDIAPESINIISNNIDIEKGDFNAEFVRFDMGMNKYKLGRKNNNYIKTNDYSRLKIHNGAGINSQLLLIKSAGSDVNNQGRINTRILVAKSNVFNNAGVLDLNQGSNIYASLDSSKNRSFIGVNKYFGSSHSEVNVINAGLYIQAKQKLYLGGQTDLENSEFFAHSNKMNIVNLNLLNSAVDVKSKNLIVSKGINGTGTVALEGKIQFRDKSNFNLNNIDYKNYVGEGVTKFNSTEIVKN